MFCSKCNCRAKYNIDGLVICGKHIKNVDDKYLISKQGPLSKAVSTSNSSSSASHSNENSSNDTIYFYSNTSGPYRCFSNFFKVNIRMLDYDWPTSEHIFQAMKFYKTNDEHFEKIKNAKTPTEAKKLGTSRSVPLRDDWEQVKDKLMYDIVLQKFLQNEEIKEILLSTDNKRLVEHTKNDSYWAGNGDGTGKNQLGITLMSVRYVLKKEF